MCYVPLNGCLCLPLDDRQLSAVNWRRALDPGYSRTFGPLIRGGTTKDIARSSGTHAGLKSTEKGSEDGLRWLVDLFRLIPRPTEKGRVLIAKMAQSRQRGNEDTSIFGRVTSNVVTRGAVVEHGGVVRKVSGGKNG